MWLEWETDLALPPCTTTKGLCLRLSVSAGIGAMTITNSDISQPRPRQTAAPD